MSRYLRYAMAMLIILMGVAGSAGAALSAPQPGTSGDVLSAQGATGTVSASIYICDGQEGVIWGGAPGASCYAANASLVLYLKGDGTDDHWTVASGTSGVVPAGTHEVYENVHWTMKTIDVAAGATTSITVLLPGKALPPPPPPPPPPPATAPVSVSVYTCDGQTGVIWGGTPGSTCYGSSASLLFYLIGDGSDAYWTIASGGSKSLPVGSYEVYENVYWSMGTVTVPAGGTHVNVLLPGKALPPPPPPPAATGTVTMNKYICDGVSKVTWGGSADANCDPAKASFYFYLIGDGTDDYWTLHVDGSGSRSLPVGTYEVYESGTWSMSKVTIAEGKTTTVTVLNPGKPLPPPPAPEGTATVNKYVCNGISTVTWGGSPDGNCVPGKATFYFYLIGDGLDTYHTLYVNGSASIDLPAGSYEVWEDGHWSMSKITVADGKTTIVNVLNPGKPLPPPAPDDGTVTISKYVCDGQKGVIWNGTPGSLCRASKATFYFYLIGDGLDTYETLYVNGSASIDLAPGTYEVWEDGYWTMGKVTVEENKTTTVNVLNPGKPLPPPPPPTGEVEISKFVCDDVDKVTWNGTPDAECDAGSAVFYFYLIGDGTADYWVLTVDGTDSRELPVGTYEVWEDGTWSSAKVTIKDGETTYVDVLNPGD